MSKQTIFRVEKNRDNPYVMLDKLFLEYPTLSYRAKGLLGYLLSKPDHWKLTIKDLVNHGTEGRDAVYTTLRELIQHGFLQHICYRDQGKISHYEYVVYEKPQKLIAEATTYSTTPSRNPLPEKWTPAPSFTENQETENPEDAQPQHKSLPSGNPEADSTLGTPELRVPPEKPYTANPTLGINDFSNKLINKACSSRARCTLFDLWQEIFQDELSQQEYQALLKVSPRTTVARTLCLIQEHHTVPSIISPFAFVMSCLVDGGYKVPQKVSTPTYWDQKRTVHPMPKSMQRQRSGEQKPQYSPEEIARKKAQIEEKLRLLYTNNPDSVEI